MLLLIDSGLGLEGCRTQLRAHDQNPSVCSEPLMLPLVSGDSRMNLATALEHFQGKIT